MSPAHPPSVKRLGMSGVRCSRSAAHAKEGGLADDGNGLKVPVCAYRSERQERSRMSLGLNSRDISSPLAGCPGMRKCRVEPSETLPRKHRASV